jgi:flagellar hook assembly protein FlgD
MLFILCSLPLSAEILDVEVLWDIEDEPVNIGDLIHFKVTTDASGSVIVDISTVHQSIQLYDDGTNGDAVKGDHIHELDYTIFEGDTVEDGPILVRFITNDGIESWTGPDDDITPHITIDGTRPLVTNDGVSPSPFNPYNQFAYIRYILTERARVSVRIYDGDGQLVRELGTPSGRPGENHTTWDGADSKGNIAPDGAYTYVVNATDAAGNDAIPISSGCILSTVHLEIVDSLISPNPFSPDGDDVDDIAWVSFGVELIATEQQLRVLGFGPENLVTAIIEDDDIVSPYALIGVSIYDSTGKSQKFFTHDLTPEADTDNIFALPTGWPNQEMPSEVPLGSGNILGPPGSIRDYPDADKNNDWDTLIPLHGPFTSDTGGAFYATEFAVGWDAKGTPDGTYLISLECELVGRIWMSAGYMEAADGYIIGEKWHAEPARHHGITAFPTRKSVIIDRREVVPVDDDPPIVTSTSPSAGATIDPTRESIKEIMVVLDDGADGSGVDPIQSTVRLLDPLLNKLGGQITPYGINTIKLVLDFELAVSGTYTIEVIPVDKRGNKGELPLVYEFVVEDTSAPIVVPNTVRPRPTEFDDDGNAIEPYNQPIESISVALTDGLTGSGVDLENSALYLRDSTDEPVAGELAVDEENKKLIYTFEEPIVVSDTYTIVVIAIDRAGAKGIYTYQFALDMAENIVVGYGGKTYLMIYASTTVVSEVEDPAGLLKEITVQETEEFPEMLAEISPITEVAMKFKPSGIELSQDADLTLYYEDTQLPLGISETELAIYAYKPQARDWVQLPNTVLAEEENKLTANINNIDEYYIIAYTSPITPSLVEEVLLEPPKYFNPDKESLIFTFARNMTDYEVQIYNVAGDRIVDLKEQGRADGSLGWDGRNDDDEIVRNGVFICRILYTIDDRSKSLNRLIAVVK